MVLIILKRTVKQLSNYLANVYIYQVSKAYFVQQLVSRLETYGVCCTYYVRTSSPRRRLTTTPLCCQNVTRMSRMPKLGKLQTRSFHTGTHLLKVKKIPEFKLMTLRYLVYLIVGISRYYVLAMSPLFRNLSFFKIEYQHFWYTENLWSNGIHCCGSGSVQICIIFQDSGIHFRALQDPDPDL